MAPESEQKCEDANSPPTPVERQQTLADLKNERTKATRHPRWTREETIVLVKAKKVVENGGKPAFAPSGCVLSEPKWDLVSSICQRQGVERGPDECRKRWSNVLSDFKKIKKWESSIKEEDESFWKMRKVERREKKLPGFFDGELYNALDGGVCTAAAFPLTLVKMRSKGEDADGIKGVVSEQCGEDEEDAEAIVDSEEMGWNTEEETIETNATSNKVNTPLKASAAKETIKRGTHPLPSSGCEREPVSHEGCKRRRLSPDNYEDTTNFSNDVIKVLRRNSNLQKASLGAQDINYQLARDQQKEQTNSLVAALGKLTEALTKIADRL